MSSPAVFSSLSFISAAIIRLFGVGIIISSLEYLVTLRAYNNQGLFSWQVFKLNPRILNSPLSEDRWDMFFGKNAFTVVTLVRLAAAILLVAQPYHATVAVSLAIIALTSLLINIRNSIGNDGSDQMNTIVCLSMLTGAVFDNPEITRLSIYFICFQAVISYEVAGIAKFASVSWRRGMAIYDIMNTRTYGSKTISAWLRSQSPAWTRFLNWNIILVECLFPLVLVFPLPWSGLFMVWGLAFHVYNAVFMGLNGFFWAFMACYPAIIYCNILLHQ